MSLPQALVYGSLAAKETGLTVEKLRELIVSDDLEVHGVLTAESCWIERRSVDRLKARKP